MNRSACRLPLAIAIALHAVLGLEAEPIHSVEFGFAEAIRSAATSRSGDTETALILAGGLLHVLDGTGIEIGSFDGAKLGGEPIRVTALGGEPGAGRYIVTIALPDGNDGLRLIETGQDGVALRAGRLDDDGLKGPISSLETFCDDANGTYIVIGKPSGLSVATLGFGPDSALPSSQRPFDGLAHSDGTLAAVKSWGADGGRLYLAAAFMFEETFHILVAEFRDGLLVGRAEIGAWPNRPDFRMYSDPSGVALVVDTGFSYAVQLAAAGWRVAAEGTGRLMAIAPLGRVNGPWFAFAATEGGTWIDRIDLPSGVVQRAMVSPHSGPSPAILPIVEGGSLRFAILSSMSSENDVIVRLDASGAIAEIKPFPEFRPEPTGFARAYGGPRGTVYLGLVDGTLGVRGLDATSGRLVDAGFSAMEAVTEFPLACIVDGNAYLALDRTSSTEVVLMSRAGPSSALRIVGSDADALGNPVRLLAVDGARFFIINIQD